MIASLPWTFDGKDEIVNYVEQILQLNPEDDAEKIAEIDARINAIVYNIFSLSQSEIDMIEAASKV